jgi:very-short-patch-repair endonuclease
VARRLAFGSVNPSWGYWLTREQAISVVSRLAEKHDGVFRGRDAVACGVSRNQLGILVGAGALERVLPDTYRVTAVRKNNRQALRAALLWAGAGAAAAGRSAAELYELEGVVATQPEIVTPRRQRLRAPDVVVHRPHDPRHLMLRQRAGLLVTGVEPTLVALAASLDAEQFEIACEDARRRRLTSVAALTAYLDRFGGPGHAGVASLRRLISELDPVNAARSKLEVRTRRLLVEHGFRDFVREFPLTWNGNTYRFDFAFVRRRTILEANGRRWHDDPNDYERDNEKWSVPGRFGYRIVFATWDKVTRRPQQFIAELRSAMSA